MRDPYYDALIRETVNRIRKSERAARPRQKPQGKAYGTHTESEWIALRWAVFRRDGFTCRYCGDVELQRPQCDHVIPRALGGPHSLDNLVTACGPCNASKGARRLEEWRP
jgi:5-methylcytosine-specific restriction endonuclease McrA